MVYIPGWYLRCLTVVYTRVRERCLTVGYTRDGERGRHVAQSVLPPPCVWEACCAECTPSSLCVYPSAQSVLPPPCVCVPSAQRALPPPYCASRLRRELSFLPLPVSLFVSSPAPCASVLSVAGFLVFMLLFLFPFHCWSTVPVPRFFPFHCWSCVLAPHIAA